jgi:hypothetical protein
VDPVLGHCSFMDEGNNIPPKLFGRETEGTVVVELVPKLSQADRLVGAVSSLGRASDNTNPALDENVKLLRNSPVEMEGSTDSNVRVALKQLECAPDPTKRVRCDDLGERVELPRRGNSEFSNGRRRVGRDNGGCHGWARKRKIVLWSEFFIAEATLACAEIVRYRIPRRVTFGEAWWPSPTI